jgi:hypothetical protein
MVILIALVGGASTLVVLALVLRVGLVFGEGRSRHRRGASD